MKQDRCPLCGKEGDADNFQAPSQLNKDFVALVNKDHPGWQVNTPVCLECYQKYHSRSLASEWTRFTRFERDMVRRITRRLTATRNINVAFDESLTFGQRVADRVAQFGGSWTFIFLFGGVLAVWVILNSIILVRTSRGAFDTYPYILLNLFLSMLAALQAPVIMMSQNRQSAKDRLDASHDYEVNLKAELEIQELHQKMDELRAQQWRELVKMQREQIDFLTSIAGHLGCAVESLTHRRETESGEEGM